jgi:oxygen-independent coproporphyrinogen-3 oxidase
MLRAILLEMEQRKDYLSGEELNTIYFGGGTPTLFSPAAIASLIDKVASLHPLNAAAEITIEANPDDLDPQSLRELKNAGINRLSIGVQSFQPAELKLLNRAHDSFQAEKCIRDAQDTGLENITIDLIYGIPGQSDTQWEQNLDKVSELGINHLSSYALTVEQKTVLAHMIRKGDVQEPDEEKMARHFMLLQQWAESNEFEAYEISNYARQGHRAVHNTAYWQNKPYLGAGPSAHSYNGLSRRWNIANNALYIKNIHAGAAYFETETLSAENKYNEYVMTSLRTIWGSDLQFIAAQFGKDYAEHFSRSAAEYLEQGLLLNQGNCVILSRTGKLLADHIIAELFIISENENTNPI